MFVLFVRSRAENSLDKCTHFKLDVCVCVCVCVSHALEYDARYRDVYACVCVCLCG